MGSPTVSGGLLLANSEAPKFRLTYDPSEGTEAWSTPCGNLGFVGGENEVESARHTWLTSRGLTEALPEPGKHLSAHPAIPRSILTDLSELMRNVMAA
jgi:hypothetical protein